MLAQSTKQMHRVHHHMMEKTLFISLIAIYPMVEEEGGSHSNAHHADKGAYDHLYHYGIDTTKRHKIEVFNKKYALNSCF